MTAETATLREWIENARSIAYFGGAGTSTASGVPDFRSAGQGLYNVPGGRSYEEMLSHDYFTRFPDEFWNFYRRAMLYPDARPNAAHIALAKLEKAGKCGGVVTQNIDGLHQAAGSEKVWELHGSVLRNHCVRCGEFYALEDVAKGEGAPRCARCGGVVKPDVVLYGEALDDECVAGAIRVVRECDLLIVGGTSLVVYPAAGLIRYRPRGSRLALLNREPTPYDGEADLIIREDLSRTLAEATEA